LSFTSFPFHISSIAIISFRFAVSRRFVDISYQNQALQVMLV
jgi:hypothetical protein